MALRFKCPIYTTEEILSKAGIVLEAEDKDSPNPASMEPKAEPTGSSPFAHYNMQELEEMLNEAIKNEDYEKASVIRDEIHNRKKN